MSTQSERVASLAAEGLSLQDIARRLGVSRTRVSQVVKEHGIKRRDLRKDATGPPPSDQTKRILKAAPALAKAGLTKSEAAREMGVSPVVFAQAVYKRLPDVEWRDGNRQISKQTKRILDAVPGLAERGLSKAEAARELGVQRDVFTLIVHRHLPDVEWRDGRADSSGRPLADQTKRILDAAPALAKRGLAKTEAARELGVSPNSFFKAVRRHIPEVEWRNGRKKAAASVRKAELIKRMKAECAGMTMKEAATHLGISYETIWKYKRESVFSGLVREPNPRRGCFGERTRHLIEAAPVLAERGLSKADAARELGLSPAVFTTFLHKRCSDIQWRDGRARAPGTVKDDERSTMRSVMAETLAGAEQPPIRDGGGIGR